MGTRKGHLTRPRRRLHRGSSQLLSPYPDPTAFLTVGWVPTCSRAPQAQPCLRSGALRSGPEREAARWAGRCGADEDDPGEDLGQSHQPPGEEPAAPMGEWPLSAPPRPPASPDPCRATRRGLDCSAPSPARPLSLVALSPGRRGRPSGKARGRAALGAGWRARWGEASALPAKGEPLLLGGLAVWEGGRPGSDPGPPSGTGPLGAALGASALSRLGRPGQLHPPGRRSPQRVQREARLGVLGGRPAVSSPETQTGLLPTPEVQVHAAGLRASLLSVPPAPSPARGGPLPSHTGSHPVPLGPAAVRADWSCKERARDERAFAARWALAGLETRGAALLQPSTRWTEVTGGGDPREGLWSRPIPAFCWSS